MAKFFITAPIDYIMGYLKYGHFEGEIEVLDSEIENFKANPVDWIEEHDKEDDLDLIVDNWEIEERGDIESVNWKEIKDVK